MRTQKAILFSVLTAFWFAQISTVQAAIENNPNKEYRLHDVHGPWMVMVASFSNVRDPDFKKEGLTAEEAARKLVHELRAANIPAYVFSQDSKKGEIDTYNRLGTKEKRVYRAQDDMICVLAGNYKKIDDPTAQATLAHIKKFRPKFMADPKSGAIVRDGANGKNGPFVGAFLTINPMINPKDVVNRKVDDVTKSLNSGIEYPLVSLKRKYTLKVATFTGKSAIPMGSSKYSGREGNFEKAIEQGGAYSLARAGEDATQLTYALRLNTNATKQALKRERFEAYVYHDQFQSYVAVGGFDSPNDPEIRRLYELFAAKYEKDEGESEYRLKCKSLSLPGNGANSMPIQTWPFDPIPELIEVPRIR